MVGESKVKGSEMFAIKAGTGADLLGFSAAAPDDEEGFQGGRRGGRGRGDRSNTGRGGGRGG